MFDFSQKKVVQFKGQDGEITELEYPKVKNVNNFRKKLKVKGADEVDEAINFLCELGAKKEVIESLEVAHINTLITELTKVEDEKKK